MPNHSGRLVCRKKVPLAEDLVGFSLPLPPGIVATDMSPSENEGARVSDRGGGWGKQERKL